MKNPFPRAAESACKAVEGLKPGSPADAGAGRGGQPGRDLTLSSGRVYESGVLRVKKEVPAQVISLLSKEDGLRLATEHGIEPWVASIDGFRPIMHSPAVASAVANLLLVLMTRNTLSARSRELVILRIGWRAGSEYEFCNHVRVSSALKMSDEEILGVRDPDKCEAYSEADRAVIRMADELIDGTEVSASTQAALTATFSEAERVELLIAAGFWRMMACWLKTVKVPLEPEVPGWPEGRRPF